jgi:hypothetical protein
MADREDRAPEERLQRLTTTFDAYDRTGACADDWRGLADDALTALEEMNITLMTLITVLARRGITIDPS